MVTTLCASHRASIIKAVVESNNHVEVVESNGDDEALLPCPLLLCDCVYRLSLGVGRRRGHHPAVPHHATMHWHMRSLSTLTQPGGSLRSITTSVFLEPNTPWAATTAIVGLSAATETSPRRPCLFAPTTFGCVGSLRSMTLRVVDELMSFLLTTTAIVGLSAATETSLYRPCFASAKTLGCVGSLRSITLRVELMPSTPSLATTAMVGLSAATDTDTC
mmetsp:Transcript_5804/g.12217  ORF Transcript_5804/g.12217 Transcript_5804/m.12217 type:complete len:219 (+) Transcript_5804:550-1206(+)